MNSTHQDTIGFRPPNTGEEIHRQPPSSTTGDNLPDSTTLHLPHTPSPMAPATETNAPESPISASLDGAVFTTPPTSFHGAAAATTTTAAAVNTHNPVRRTLTDTNSFSNQDQPTLTTTPPDVSDPPGTNTLLRRSHIHPIKTDSQEHRETKTPAPKVSTRKRITQSKLREIEDEVREIKQRILDVLCQSQEQAENENPPQEMVKQEEECVGVERADDDDDDDCFLLKLSCSCGKRKGICRDVVFFLSIMLILFSFFMIGVAYIILLVLQILFP